jgi:hypothetical protein
MATKKPKYEDAEQVYARHSEAVAQARRGAGNQPARSMLELERAAVEKSGGVAPLPLDDDGNAMLPKAEKAKASK